MQLLDEKNTAQRIPEPSVWGVSRFVASTVAGSIFHQKYNIFIKKVKVVRKATIMAKIRITRSSRIWNGTSFCFFILDDGSTLIFLQFFCFGGSFMIIM